MKMTHYLPLTVIAALAVSCAPKGGGDGYDVSNPYAAPDYADETGGPVIPSDVNPAYDAPAVYEEAVATTPEASPPVVVTPARPKVHTVGRGDTLWGLSKQYGVPIASIKAANNLTRDTAVLGSKLIIPAN